MASVGSLDGPDGGTPGTSSTGGAAGLTGGEGFSRVEFLAPGGSGKLMSMYSVWFGTMTGAGFSLTFLADFEEAFLEVEAVTFDLLTVLPGVRLTGADLPAVRVETGTALGTDLVEVDTGLATALTAGGAFSLTTTALGGAFALVLTVTLGGDAFDLTLAISALKGAAESRRARSGWLIFTAARIIQLL